MKTIKTLLILLCMFSVKTYAQYENFEWTITPDNNYYSKAFDVETDINNDIYVTGRFKDTLIIQNDTLFSPLNNNVFIAKFDSSQNLLWLKQSKGNCIIDGLIKTKIDNNGDFFVVGDYKGSELIFENDTLLPVDYYSMYIAKYSSNGVLLWTRSQEFAWTQDITVDSLGNLYIAVFYTYYVIFDQDTIWGNSNYEGCVVKFSSTGVYQWSRQLHSPEHDSDYNYDNRISSITSDTENNIYLVAWFHQKAILNDSLFTAEQSGMLVTKLSPDNNIIWNKKYDTWTNPEKKMFNKEISSFYTYIISDYNNNIYVINGFYPNINFADTTIVSVSGYLENHFILKFDENGNEINASHIAGAFFESMYDKFCISLNNDFFFTSSCDDSLLINDTVINITEGNRTIIKFNNNNNFDTYIEIPSKLYLSITVDNNNSIFIAGADFNNYIYDFQFIMAKVKGFNTSIIPSSLNNSNNNITIYPNPNTGIINFNNPNNEAAQVYLYNLQGKLVYKTKTNQNNTEISLPENLTGMFIIKIQNKNSVFTQKIIIN